MPKLVTSPVGNFNTAGLVTLEQNYDKIEAAVENTLSRDGTGPNQMEADLDMNDNDILNVQGIQASQGIFGQIVIDGKVIDVSDLVPIIYEGIPSLLDFRKVGDTTWDAAFERAWQVTRALWVPPSATSYEIEQIVVPDNAMVTAKGATLRIVSQFSGRTPKTIEFGTNAYWDELNLESSGLEGNRYGVLLKDDCRVDYIQLRADNQRGGGGYVCLNGSRIHLGYIDSEKVDRPLITNNPATDWVYDIYIGGGRIRNFVRGIRLTMTERFYLGTFHMSEMSPNGTPGHSPGENGILLSGTRDGYIADQYISDSPEHAIRMGGGSFVFEAEDPNDDVQVPVPGSQRNVNFGNLYLKNSGGCALKLNPNADDTIENIYIAGVFGIDIGRNVKGSNREFLRISKCRKVRIGIATCYRYNSTDISCQVGARLSNVQDLWIGSLVIDQSNLGAVLIDDDGDAGPGNVTNVRINYLESTRQTAGSHIRLDNVGYNVGGLFIEQARFPPLNSGDVILAQSVATTISGVVFVRAYVGGTNKPNFNVNDETLVTVDCEWNGMREVGKPSTFRWNSAYTFDGVPGVLNTGDSSASPAGMRMTGKNLTVAQNEHYNYLDFGQQGGTRRGPGIAATQTGSTNGNLGLTVFRKTGTATEEIFPHTTFRHNGDAEVLTVGAGIILASPNGTRYKLTVDNSGVLGVASV